MSSYGYDPVIDGIQWEEGDDMSEMNAANRAYDDASRLASDEEEIRLRCAEAGVAYEPGAPVWNDESESWDWSTPDPSSVVNCAFCLNTRACTPRSGYGLVCTYCSMYLDKES